MALTWPELAPGSTAGGGPGRLQLASIEPPARARPWTECFLVTRNTDSSPPLPPRQEAGTTIMLIYRRGNKSPERLSTSLKSASARSQRDVRSRPRPCPQPCHLIHQGSEWREMGADSGTAPTLAGGPPLPRPGYSPPPSPTSGLDLATGTSLASLLQPYHRPRTVLNALNSTFLIRVFSWLRGQGRCL